jgi:hypothetical protein
VKTDTGDKRFDAHVQQMYLDNSLRGGVPVFLGTIDDKSQSLSVDEDSRIKVYHLFSRIHGDLERGELSHSNMFKQELFNLTVLSL